MMPPNSILKGQETINLAPFLAVLNYQIDREVDFTHVHTFKFLTQSNYVWDSKAINLSSQFGSLTRQLKNLSFSVGRENSSICM